MMLRPLILSVVIVLGAGAASGCASESYGARAAAAAAEADAVLANYRPTGETRSCLNTRSIEEIDPIDDTRWLVTTRGGDVYLNEVSRGCSGAARDFTYLQYRSSTTSLCSNEIVQVIDRGSNMAQGSCGLGTFQELARIGDAG